MRISENSQDSQTGPELKIAYMYTPYSFDQTDVSKTPYHQYSQWQNMQLHDQIQNNYKSVLMKDKTIKSEKISEKSEIS